MNTLEFASPRSRERRREPISLPTDRLWTVHQAAAFLGRSQSWVYKAAERGELPRARGMGWGLELIQIDGTGEETPDWAAAVMAEAERVRRFERARDTLRRLSDTDPGGDVEL